jgi:hypothetical protein
MAERPVVWISHRTDRDTAFVTADLRVLDFTVRIAVLAGRDSDGALRGPPIAGCGLYAGRRTSRETSVRVQPDGVTNIIEARP